MNLLKVIMDWRLTWFSKLIIPEAVWLTMEIYYYFNFWFKGETE